VCWTCRTERNRTPNQRFAQKRTLSHQIRMKWLPTELDDYKIDKSDTFVWKRYGKEAYRREKPKKTVFSTNNTTNDSTFSFPLHRSMYLSKICFDRYPNIDLERSVFVSLSALRFHLPRITFSFVRRIHSARQRFWMLNSLKTRYTVTRSKWHRPLWRKNEFC
jgi:hypothetical protein